MGKRQMSKGYRQRQRDLQHERWKKYLHKERQKIHKTKTKSKGVVLQMSQSSQQLVDMAEELRQSNVNKDRYRGAWEAEKQIAESFRLQVKAQRKLINRQRKIIECLHIGLTVFALLAMWALLR